MMISVTPTGAFRTILGGRESLHPLTPAILEEWALPVCPEFLAIKDIVLLVASPFAAEVLFLLISWLTAAFLARMCSGVGYGDLCFFCLGCDAGHDDPHDADLRDADSRALHIVRSVPPSWGEIGG